MQPDSLDDTLGLLAQVRHGIDGAADTLLERYRERVTRVVSLRLRRRRRDLLAIEEDLVQETLLDAFRGLPEFRLESEGAFMAWLARLAENNLNDAARRALAEKRGGGSERRMADLRNSDLSTSIFAGEEPTPSQWAMGKELEEQLEDALLGLPERQRRAIELRRLCGASFELLARELELGSESSARGLFSRAMAALSDKL